MNEDKGLARPGTLIADTDAPSGVPAPRVTEAAPAVRKPKRVTPARGEAFGILNPWGDLWTYRTFETVAWAEHYIRDYWNTFPANKRPDVAKFKVIPVKVTVSAK